MTDGHTSPPGGSLGIVLVTVLLAATLGAVGAVAGSSGTQPTPSEAASVDWTRTYEIPRLYRAEDILPTDDGGFLVVGTRQTDTGTDGWALRVAPNRTVRWTRYYGGDRDDEFLAAHRTRDGGFLVGGATQSYRDGDASLGTDGWAVRLAANGTERWNRSYDSEAEQQRDYGDAYADERVELVADARDGGHLLLGAFTPHELGYGHTVGGVQWAVGVDEAGDERWNRSYDIGGISTGFAFGNRTETGLVVGGVVADETGPGRDVAVARLDDDGRIEGSVDVPEPEGDGVYTADASFAALDDGDVLVLRDVNSEGNRTVEDRLYRVRPDDGVVWQRHYERATSESDPATALAPRANGVLVLETPSAGNLTVTAVDGNETAVRRGPTGLRRHPPLEPFATTGDGQVVFADRGQDSVTLVATTPFAGASAERTPSESGTSTRPAAAGFGVVVSVAALLLFLIATVRRKR